MKSVLEFVTPYRRVCGAVLLLLVAVIAPNLHFAVAIASNAGAAQASLWIVYVLYAGFAWLPAVRRVSERASFVVLLGVGLVVEFCYGFDSSLKQALARAAGMFGAPALWDGVPFIDDTQEFIHPYAGYRLRVPQTWQLSQGPLTGASQFTLQLDGTAAAIARRAAISTKHRSALRFGSWKSSGRSCGVVAATGARSRLVSLSAVRPTRSKLSGGSGSPAGRVRCAACA